MLFILTGCLHKSLDDACTLTSTIEDHYYLLLLVDAKHLDYTDSTTLVKSLKKSDNFGHAWIYLQGIEDGKLTEIEGGHSGDVGRVDAKYFDGIMNYIESGNSDPIKYLWSTLRDGFYQQGNGGHCPTFAAKIDISKDQFNHILTFIEPFNYAYSNYSLTHHQCTSFVVQIAALIGIVLPAEVTIPIRQEIRFGSQTYRLWEDPQYSSLIIQSPDVLEKSLIELVNQNQAENGLCWYFTPY